MTEREERIGRNEAVFREFNEQIRAVDQAFTVPGDDLLPLICECGDSLCTERVELRRDEYERLRADETLFAVVPGHVASDVEDVVEQRGGYDVVRKRPGVPEQVARETNPRT